ncbi:MAG: hypothetical protein LBQ86_08325 [Holophagales bacterium]|jgi:hypothetical protein|nr:hypothetical protein [Holophagales bacterium]
MGCNPSYSCSLVPIKGYRRLQGHVPIIAQNKRRGKAIPMKPAQALRFRERSSVERVNSNLKDNYGYEMYNDHLGSPKYETNGNIDQSTTGK